jgi:hypothetical protein
MTMSADQLNNERPSPTLTVRDATVKQMFDELAARVGPVGPGGQPGIGIIIVLGRPSETPGCTELGVMTHGNGVPLMLLEVLKGQGERLASIVAEARQRN